jgi:hypothetical protein
MLPPALPWRRRIVAFGSVTAPSRRLVYAVCTALALLCNYALGVDACWDTLNYHLYAGLSAVHDRFAQDYFAAGPQSYFNPYAYAPFYALVSSGLPALAVSSILAIAHSAILWLTYELAICVCPSDDRRIRLTVGLCAVALAFLNPILIQQIGSSFSDITTAVLVLAGWLLLARAVRAPHAAPIAWGGLLLGAATALKLTNALHAVAAMTLLLFVPRSLTERTRYAISYAGTLTLGFAIVAAPWAYRLAQRFRNPFFPLLNGVFRSPEFTTEALHHYRFIPDSLAEALWRPFAILNPVPMVHEEASAPDLRYAVLLVLVSGIVLRWLWQRHNATPTSPLDTTKQSQDSSHVLTALGCGLAVDWTAWLSASGNGRYFLPMASVTAVLIVALLFRELAAWRKVRNYALVVILGIQSVQLWMGAEYRWDPLPWGGPWFKIDMPANLALEPTLHLTIGVQSNSFVAAYVADGAGLVNVSGGYALGRQGANGARINAIIKRYAPRVRVLLPGARLYEDAEQRAPLRSQVDDVLERFDLHVDPRDCTTITVRGVPPALEIQMVGRARAAEPQSRDTTKLLSCLTVPNDPAVRAVLLAHERTAELVLNRLEDACPKLFQPHRLQTEHIGSRWQRYYLNTDLMAWVNRGQVSFHDLLRDDGLIYLGRESDWVTAPLRLTCGRHDGHYFARVLESPEGP